MLLDHLDLEHVDDDTLAALVGSTGDAAELARPTVGEELGEWRKVCRAKIAKSNETQRAFRAAAVKGGVLRKRLKGKVPTPAAPATKKCG